MTTITQDDVQVLEAAGYPVTQHSRFGVHAFGHPVQALPGGALALCHPRGRRVLRAHAESEIRPPVTREVQGVQVTAARDADFRRAEDQVKRAQAAMQEAGWTLTHLALGGDDWSAFPLTPDGYLGVRTLESRNVQAARARQKAADARRRAEDAEYRERMNRFATGEISRTDRRLGRATTHASHASTLHTGMMLALALGLGEAQNAVALTTRGR